MRELGQLQFSHFVFEERFDEFTLHPLAATEEAGQPLPEEDPCLGVLDEGLLEGPVLDVGHDREEGVTVTVQALVDDPDHCTRF